MTIRAILTTALSLVLGLVPLQAQETAVTVMPPLRASVEATASEHPFYETGVYPEWSRMEPGRALQDLKGAAALARERINIICSLEPGTETFENVFEAFEQARFELDCVSNYLRHLSNVADSQEMRRVMEDFVQEITAIEAEFRHKARLWEVMKRAAAQPWVQELSPAKQRYIQQMLDEFRDSGADLAPEQQARLQEIVTEMSQLQLKFDKNVQDSVNHWFRIISKRSQLKGMPEDWMKQNAEYARKCGAGSLLRPQWIITMSSVEDVMKHCTVPATRKIAWQGFNSIAKQSAYDNAPVVARVMELRQEMAELLGYKNYADLVCHNRMVASGDQALAFVQDMMERLRPAFDKENRELLDFISAKEGRTVETIAPWDYPYYLHQFTMERCDFDAASVAPYLRSDKVLQGMFDHFSKLYGITITELPAVCLQPGDTCPEGHVEVWCEGVRVFKVTDNATGAHLGSFYLDASPHSGKQSGEWVMPLRVGRRGKNGAPHEPHLAVLVGDFPAPTDKGYALYTQRDVTGLFHEFGHMMHMMLNDTELVYQSTIGVAWDFVELPSKLNENWAWEPEVIATYAAHHETGDPMPEEMLQKLIASRDFMPVGNTMDLLRSALLDMEMHMHYAEKFAGKPLDDVSDELLAPWRTPSTVKEASPMRRLSHCISGGYTAGLFSYQWADVMAADAYTRFQKEGVRNPETGAAYRRTILQRGAEKSAADLYREFMGHDPDPAPLLKRYGIEAN